MHRIIGVFSCVLIAAIGVAGVAQAANVTKTYLITWPSPLVAGPGGARSGGTVASNLLSGTVVVNPLACPAPNPVFAVGSQFEVDWSFSCLGPGSSYQVELTADGPFHVVRAWFIDTSLDTVEAQFTEIGSDVPGSNDWALIVLILALGGAGVLAHSRRRPREVF